MNESADITAYIDLLVSLPELKSPFVSQQLPISLWQLDKRLGQLLPQHRQVLDSVRRAVNRSVPQALLERLAPVVEDAPVASEPSLQVWCRYWGLQVLYNCLQSQLDRRCLLAALRRRLGGAAPPAADTYAGISSCGRQIVRQWSQPHFQLQHRFPWLPAARDLLERGDCAALERLLVQLAWDDYGRCWEHCCRVGYEHNLPAIILYVLRWQLVDDWLAQSTAHSATVFDDVVTELLGTATALTDSMDSMASGDTQ